MSSTESKKRKKNYYLNVAKKRKGSSVQPEMKGFLVTFERSEFQATKDCYDLLNEYADKIWGPENPEKKSEKAIEDELEEELEDLKDTKTRTRRFQKMKTDVSGNFFINSTVDDPGRLTTAIFQDLKEKRSQRSRFVLRLLPVHTTCKAFMESIKKAVEMVLANFDDSTLPNRTFLVADKIRHNNNLQHNVLLKEIVDVVKAAKPLWVGELKNPDLVLMLDVQQSICCVCLMPSYMDFKKYNLLELTKPAGTPQDATSMKHEEVAEKDINDASEDEREDKITLHSEQVTDAEPVQEEVPPENRTGNGLVKDEPVDTSNKVETDAAASKDVISPPVQTEDVNTQEQVKQERTE